MFYVAIILAAISDYGKKAK